MTPRVSRHFISGDRGVPIRNGLPREGEAPAEPKVGGGRSTGAAQQELRPPGMMTFGHSGAGQCRRSSIIFVDEA